MKKLSQKDAVRFAFAFSEFALVLDSGGISFATNDDCGDSKYYREDVPNFHELIKGTGKNVETVLAMSEDEFNETMYDECCEIEDYEKITDNVNSKLSKIIKFFYAEKPFDLEEFFKKVPKALTAYERNIPRRFSGDFQDTREDFQNALDRLFEDAGMRSGISALIDHYADSYDDKTRSRLDAWARYLSSMTFEEYYEDR